MTTQKQKAGIFRDLHVKGNPLILFNIWDAGSAKVIEEAGAKAIATGSWSVAAANGFADGQELQFLIAEVPMQHKPLAQFSFGLLAPDLFVRLGRQM